MCKRLVIALFISTVSSASDQSLSSPMQIDLPAYEDGEVHELASSFYSLNTSCPPPTPHKALRRNTRQPVLTGVRKKLAIVLDQQAQNNPKRDERREKRKAFVREFNLQQTFDLPDNISLLSSVCSTPLGLQAALSAFTLDENSHSLPTRLSMPRSIIGLYEFTNQSPIGLLKPVALKPSQVYDTQASNQSSQQNEQ